MKLTVSLFGGLKRYTSFREKENNEIEVPDDTTLESLNNRLGIPGKIHTLYIVNGEGKNKDYIPEAGDKISIMPPVGGG